MKGAKSILSIFSLLLLFPVVAFGEGFEPDLILLKAVLALSPILSGIFLLYFVYGFVMYTRWYHDGDRQEQGRLAMTWAVIAIVGFAVLWGIANWVDESFYTTVQTSDLSVVDSGN
ncbi:MAG: hypothetical protein ISR99_03105 [Parcubacteria group bacterium]|nr:hypothetical protein [Parcubacteria group bacterium]